MSLREGGGGGDERAKSPLLLLQCGEASSLLDWYTGHTGTKGGEGGGTLFFSPPPSSPPQDPNRGKRMRKEGQDGFFALPCPPTSSSFPIPTTGKGFAEKIKHTSKKGAVSRFYFSFIFLAIPIPPCCSFFVFPQPFLPVRLMCVVVVVQ